MAGSSKIWLRVEKFGWEWKVLAGSKKFGWECKILDGSGKVWLGVVKFGWVYIQRFGWVWIQRMVDFKGLPFLSYFLSFWVGVGKFG